MTAMTSTMTLTPAGHDCVANFCGDGGNGVQADTVRSCDDGNADDLRRLRQRLCRQLCLWRR